MRNSPPFYPQFGIIHRDFITRILIPDYKGPDIRTTITVSSSTCHAFYLSFLLSNIAYFLFWNDFLILNFIFMIVSCLVGCFIGFFKYGLDKYYDLSPIRSNEFLWTLLISPALLALYGIYYIHLCKESSNNTIIFYLKYVPLQAIYSSASAFCISTMVMNCVRLIEKGFSKIQIYFEENKAELTKEKD